MWFREAAQLNYAPAHWRLSHYCRDGKAGVTQSLSDAMHHLQCAADLGLAVAMNKIGDIYDDGKLIPKNLKMSFDWHLKAAMLGNKDAVLKIADDYAHGRGVRRSIKQAIRWYCTAVKKR
jgi:TPR repeat protein